LLDTTVVNACPFCTALGPTLAQSHAASRVTALAEVGRSSRGQPTELKLHQVLDGKPLVRAGERLTVTLDLAAPAGSLVLIFGSGADGAKAGDLTWHAMAVNETSYAYFARAPLARVPAIERLPYFIPFLENLDPTIAEDAYLEFGHAPFDDVAKIAARLPMAKIRGWLVDPAVPATRKGFYGLALGLAADAADRTANAELLLEQILAPEDDFRAGFDGILGGFLLLSGEAGLKVLETRYLSNPQAADGDVRHTLTALRFYHEYGRQIPLARLQAALALLLARPEFAEPAIVDLARWQAWDRGDEVTRLYEAPAYSTPATRRAIVGFLLASPRPEAALALARLRKLDAAGVADAEKVLSQTGAVPAGQ